MATLLDEPEGTVKSRIRSGLRRLRGALDRGRDRCAMSTHTHQEIEELLGAYALDAVDDDERDLVEAHLAGCPRCRAEVAATARRPPSWPTAAIEPPRACGTASPRSLEEAPPELDLAHVLDLDDAREQAGPGVRSRSAAAAAIGAVAAGVHRLPRLADRACRTKRIDSWRPK